MRVSILSFRFWPKAILAVAVGLTVTLIAPQVAFAASIANPAGVLLSRGDVGFPVNPISSLQYFTNASVLGSNTATFAGTTYEWKALNSDATCRLQWEYAAGTPPTSGNLADNLELHPYTTDVIQILVAGTYTFRVVASAGVADPFMALYDSSGFAKATPDSNLIGCNDDSGYSDGDSFSDNGVDTYPYPSYDGYWSEFSVNIPSTGNYTLMMATYEFYQNDTDWYAGVAAPGYAGASSLNYTSQANGDSGSGSAATATYEYWGPAGGINGTIACVGCSPYGGSGSSSSSSAAGIMLDFQGAVANPAAGSPIHVGGTGIKPNSPYTLSLSSPLSVLASGNTNAGGEFWQPVELPAGLSAGTYTLTLRATGADGLPLTLVKTFTVGSNGTITVISDTVATPQLANTGTDRAALNLGLSVSGLLIVVGIVTMIAARRRVGKQAV